MKEWKKRIEMIDFCGFFCGNSRTSCWSTTLKWSVSWSNMVPWRTSQCELWIWIYVWTKCLSYQNLAENLLLRWNVQNMQHQSFCSRFWSLKTYNGWRILAGYEAEKLKELGFTVRQLADHYNAQEIVAAQFPKEWNVWVFACSFWGMHRDKQMFKRIWSASILHESTRVHFFTALVVSLIELKDQLLHYPMIVAELKQSGILDIGKAADSLATCWNMSKCNCG